MAVDTTNEEWFRLPRAATPTHYDLIIKSDLQALTFTGLVTINLDVQAETDVLTFNVGPKLVVSKAWVSSDVLKSSTAALLPIELDTEHERGLIRLPHALPAGAKVRLAIAFGSDLDKSMAGYYRSTWEYEGQKGYYALTHFEPTAARRAFPSWDEPELKATFSFRMIHRTGTIPLNNMPVTQGAQPISIDEQDKLLRTTELGLPTDKIVSPTDAEPATAAASLLKSESTEWSLTTFGTTPKVSTYLVVWADGPFVHLASAYISPLTNKKVDLNIYTTKEYIHQAQFALDATAKVMPEYERVFNIPYPLPKLDTLVASDFDAGAMENYGLITGRSAIYLVDEQKGGLSARKLSASVQSHECAHQWFGNLTTMDWWSGLWLNESFATLMGEVIILDKCWPEWNSDREFIVSHLTRALELDAKRSSHPIEVPLKGDNVEAAINEIFDAISYSKGASVLRMLSKMVGTDTFLKGVSIYLKKHMYANAKTNDLWQGISEASGLDIPAIMGKWVLKQGFPVLTVTEDEDSITVRQNRFLATGDVKPEEDETLWYIPLGLKTVTAEGTPSVDAGLVLNEERETKIPLKNAKTAPWKLNADTVGVYRVAYTPNRLALLGEEAARADSAFSLEDRVGLVNDAHTLAKAGYGSTSGTLTLLKKIAAEPSFLVNSAALKVFQDLSSVWFEEPKQVQDALKKFQAEFWGPKAKALGFIGKEDDSVDVQQLRVLAIGGAAGGGDEWTINEIKTRYAAAIQGDDSQIPSDLLVAVYMNAIKYGGEKEYNALLDIYKNPATPAHKIASMYGMCASDDVTLLQRTIEFLYSGQVKEQDYMHYFRCLSVRPSSRRLLWTSTKERYDVLAERFAGNFSLGRLIESSFDALTTLNDAHDAEQFFATKDSRRYAMALSQGLESVCARAAWLTRARDDVLVWLKQNEYLA